MLSFRIGKKRSPGSHFWNLRGGGLQKRFSSTIFYVSVSEHSVILVLFCSLFSFTNSFTRRISMFGFTASFRCVYFYLTPAYSTKTISVRASRRFLAPSDQHLPMYSILCELSSIHITCRMTQIQFLLNVRHTTGAFCACLKLLLCYISSIIPPIDWFSG